MKDFVSKVIEARGPKVRTYAERNARAWNNGAAEGSDGTFTEGGAGGTAGFYPVEAPKADEFGAPADMAQGGCSTLIKISPFSPTQNGVGFYGPGGAGAAWHFAATWASWLHYGEVVNDMDTTTFDTTSNILGDSSNGAKGGGLGQNGGDVEHWGRQQCRRRVRQI